MAELEAGRVERIAHNEAAGPYIRGCPKGFTLPAIHYSPERMRSPLVRTGMRGAGQFRECSWPEAVGLVLRGLTDCRELGGSASIMDLSSAGSTGALHDTSRLTRRFLNLLGGCSAPEGNYSSNAANYALGRVFGPHYPESGLEASTMTKSAMIVLLGANIFEARLGAELQARLLEASGRGARIVFIDPRRTRTARIPGAEWIPILPGTDAALLYSLLYCLDAWGAIDEAYVDARADGFRALLDHVRGSADGLPKTPSWASSVCSLAEESILALAEAWATVKPLLLLPGYSIQRSAFGEETMRLCVALQLATGNFGLEGGSTGSLNNRLPGPKVGKIPAGEAGSPSRFPVLRWPDRILDGLKPENSRIRAVYSAGGNYLNQGADIGKSEKALASLDFMVCHDLFLTPTARWADVVLPAASPLQKEDIGVPWDGNYLLYKPKILPYEKLERSDYEIFRMLADAFGFENKYSEGLDEGGWIERLLAESEIDDIGVFKRSGFYLGRERGPNALSRFAADPNLHRLDTASGKLEFGSGERASYVRAPARAGEGAFLLVTPKKADRVHSQGGHRPETAHRSELWINREDAESLGIEEGDRVVVAGSQGKLEARALPSGDIARGVVSLYEGVWHNVPSEAERAGGKLSQAPNLLTTTRGTEESASCIMHGLEVKIEKIQNS
jgi:anaerobic dimethyl sulfoxide reductase subunit A